MQQQEQLPEFKTNYHYTYIQELLKNLLQSPANKYQTILFTNRTASIVFAMLSESQVLACGFNRIVRAQQVNPYMEYEDLVLVVALAGEQDFLEVSKFSHRLDHLQLINLGVSTEEAKARLKKLQFKTKNSVKGYKQENLDFECYLQSVFILNTRPPSQKKSNPQKPITPTITPISTSIDRLCSYLCSFQSISQFQFYLPKNNQSLKKNIEEILKKKLMILSKYHYKGIEKNQGMGATRTRVLVLERTEQLSPFVLSLVYGPLVEELGVGQCCGFVSARSAIYNTIYSMDLLSASTHLHNLLTTISQTSQHPLHMTNLQQTKKLLSHSYNPSLSKQQLSFHQSLLSQINKFMQQNIDLLILQQNICNKINQCGQFMKNGKIVQDVMEWSIKEKNQGKYQQYMGLVLEACVVGKFWWWEKREIMGGLVDEDRGKVKEFVKKVKGHCLKEIPPKIQDGTQVRQNCFRHNPNLINQLKQLETDIKQKKLTNHQILKVSVNEGGSLAKKIRTVVYVNDTVGFNEIAMLSATNTSNYQFVFRDVVTTKQWTRLLLNS